MQSKASPDEPVLGQKQSLPQSSSSAAKPIDPDTDIGEPDNGGTAGSSSTGDPATDRGGNQK